MRELDSLKSFTHLLSSSPQDGNIQTHGFCGVHLVLMGLFYTKIVLEYKKSHRAEYNTVTPTTDFNSILRNRFFSIKTIRSTRQMEGLKLLL